MPPDNVDSSIGSCDGQLPTLAELFEQLSRYDGPLDGFLTHLVQTQCRCADAQGGAILRISPDGRPQVLSVYPTIEAGATPPVWLAQAAEIAPQAAAGEATDVRAMHNPEDLYGQSAKNHLVLVPLIGGQGARGLAVYVLEKGDDSTLFTARVERLELTIVLMGLHEMRLSLQKRNNDLARLRVSMDTLAASNEHEKFAAAAMSLCNEMASTWKCERVSLGVLKGRYVQACAVSGTEKISRKMKLIQDIEAVMEESLDQDIEVILPVSQEASYVSRSASELSRRHGPSAIVSLPLRRDGKCVGVITLERLAENPFTAEQIEALRLTCELATPRLMDLHRTDRWFGAKMARGMRSGLGVLVGAKHTWLKMIAILVFAFLAFAILVKGDYTASGDMTLQVRVQHVIPAPFEGILKTVNVEVNQKVIAAGLEGETILAEMDTAELREQLAAARADRSRAVNQAQQARNENKQAQVQIAENDILKADANIHLLEQRISMSSIKSPISGTVVSGDLKRHLGRRYELGKELFQVARIENMRAELLVSEDQIAEVMEKYEESLRDPNAGKVRGRLAALGHAGRYFDFVVERITPVAIPSEGKNVFPVRVKLLKPARWMQPGMTGVAEIHIDRRPYAYIWTRRLVNWIRMKLWL
ncbi:MAG: HlyD family efflux transporter periplasmic adaptor subunit [bacterium]|nr:HlyD family efflux transporter periplasmic adaptor subunit [bacterium]